MKEKTVHSVRDDGIVLPEQQHLVASLQEDKLEFRIPFHWGQE